MAATTQVVAATTPAGLMLGTLADTARRSSCVCTACTWTVGLLQPLHGLAPLASAASATVRLWSRRARPPPGAPASRPGLHLSGTPPHGQAYDINPPPTPSQHTTLAYTPPAWDMSALVAALNNTASPLTVGE
jgi:hypothetical protein